MWKKTLCDSLGWDGYDGYRYGRHSARLRKRFLDPDTVAELFSAKINVISGITNLFVGAIQCVLYGKAGECKSL